MGRRYHVGAGLDAPVQVEILSDDGCTARVRIGDEESGYELELSLKDLPGDRVLCTTAEGSQVLDVRCIPDGPLWVVGAQAQVQAQVVDERDTWLGTGGSGDGDSTVAVAMPGRVVAVEVTEGAVVTRGQRILVIEAMKMENDVKAPRDGVVRAIRVAPGDAVEAGQPLVELE